MHDYAIETDGKMFYTQSRFNALERFIRDLVDGHTVKFWCDGDRYFTELCSLVICP